MSWDTHPFSASGYLYILKPTILFQAQVNMPTVSYPLAQLTYDNVTVGSLADCRMGMTLLLGSAPGLWDLGRIYVRAHGNDLDNIGDSSTILVGYCSQGRNIGELKIVDNAYITILDLYEEWKRPSRMLADGSVFKDYDWGLPGATSPIAHVGATKGLGFMDFVDPETGVLVVDSFDASTSIITDASGGAILFTLWQMQDGSFISGTYADPAPVVSFPPGKRWIQLEIVTTIAQRSLPRHYLIVALDGEDDPNLIPTAHKGSWILKPEGLTFQIDIRTRLDPNDYLPGTVVLWLVKEDRAGTPGSLSGFEVKFAGWLNHQASFSQGNDKDVERGQTIYCIDDATRLDQLKALATTMQRITTPHNTNMLNRANIDRYWFWYLYWHTFAPMLSDIQWSGTGETFPFMSFSSPGGNFYTICDNLAKGIGYRTIADARGRLKMKLDPMRLPIEQRSYDIKRSIAPADMVRIERTKNPFPTVGVMRATATIISSGDADVLVTPFPDVYVTAPGDVEGQGLSEAQNTYPWLAQSPLQAQERIGEDYNRANADEGWLKITLAHGGDTGLEPLDWIEVSTDETMVGWLDDPLDHERCLVQQIEFTFDDEGETMIQALIVERETNGAPGKQDPIALSNTPRLVDYDFTVSDWEFVVYLSAGVYSAGIGWLTSGASTTVAIYLEFPSPLGVTSIDMHYYKGNASAHCNVELWTFTGAWAGGITNFHESGLLDDTGAIGDKHFAHNFDGSPVDGIYLVLGGFTTNANAILIDALVTYTGL